MKLFFSFFLLLLISGCAIKSNPPKIENNLDYLQDANLHVDENGTLKLEKTYINDKKGASQHIEKTSTPLTPKPSYETIPKFKISKKKSISLKEEKKKEIIIKKDKVKVSVEAIPLNEFIDLVFSEVLKLNYTVDENIQKNIKPITLNMQQTQNAKQFYEVIKKILSLNGVKISTQNGIVFIAPSETQTQSVISDMYIAYGRTLPDDLDDNQDVMLFIPYYYVKPREIISIVRKIGFTPKEVKFYTTINSLQTIVGKASNIKKIIKLIQTLDRPFMEGKRSYLISLDQMDVEKFIAKMKSIFALNAVKISTQPSQGGIAMLPLEEINAMYVITSKQEWLDMILYWKKKLDIPPETKEEPRLYIYHVKNRKADELSAAINEVLGLTKATLQSETSSRSDVGGKNLNKATHKKEQKRVSNALLLSRAKYTPTVTADKDTNILMLKLTPKHYKIIKPFLEELDKLPLQTLVEVTVAEVDITDKFSLGFEYAIRNQSAGLIKNTLNIAGGGSGLGIVFQGNYIDTTINAYAEKQLLDIVSRPHILILNNNTGSINVGTQVPVVTSEVSSSDTLNPSGPSINRNITYRTTGINLGLTPTINSNGVLTMNISISLSEAQTNDTSGIDSPLIIDRSLDTTAVINSGDTILIGGLISHNISKTKGGIPYLKDIPLIGNIFATQNHKTTKTELIMLIRPTIIQTRREVNEETLRFRALLKNLQGIDL